MGIKDLVQDKLFLLQIEVEKRKVQHVFNWTGGSGNSAPCVSWHKGGIVMAGSDGTVKVCKTQLTSITQGPDSYDWF